MAVGLLLLFEEWLLGCCCCLRSALVADVAESRAEQSILPSDRKHVHVSGCQCGLADCQVARAFEVSWTSYQGIVRLQLLREVDLLGFSMDALHCCSSTGLLQPRQFLCCRHLNCTICVSTSLT